jgi:Flp pilus assembly pilin Flp
MRRFLVEDAGQDIVEYAFLAAFIGIAGWVTLRALDNEVYNVYSGWVDPDTGTPGLWRPPGPDGLPEPLDP